MMTRALGLALLVVMAVNLLLLAGVVAWLGATGRLSRERVQQVVAIFEPTLEQQQQAEAEAARQAELDKQKQVEVARLEQAAQGSQTLQQRLAEQDTRSQMNALIVDRLKAESAAIRQRLEMSKQTVTQLTEQLEEQRAAMEAYVAQREAQRTDEDFQQAVAFYEQMKPKQAKASFLDLIGEGRSESVIDYLSAMQPRKAGAVMREFKDEQEIAIATDLLQQLRSRGIGGADEVQTNATGATP
ncbi:MAG: hypothetical protein ACOCYN_04855 [Planctomycetota bacterium]